MKEPKITKKLISDHGLSPEEYQKICQILGRKSNSPELAISARYMLTPCNT